MTASDKLIKKTFHNQAYEYYSWELLGNDIFTLAEKILKDPNSPKFDRVVALAKGGLTFSRSLIDYVGIDSLSSIQIEFYTNIGTTAKTPVITQSLPVSIKNEHILIFDDLLDTGETMKLAKEYLQYHGAASISTAVLIEKPWSTVSADYTARTSDAWVIFPNESRETIKSLVTNWTKAGDSPEIIEKQLLEIGFTKAEVALFTKLE